MLKLPATVRVYARTVPCDMRKQIDGLAALVEHELGHDARSGHLFMAFNRRGDMVRLLFWDTNGFVLVTKRFEKGTFRLPWRNNEETSNPLELDAAELARILEGVELKRGKNSLERKRTD
jgi:transposase